MSESADNLVEQILEDARGQAERKKKKARKRAEKIRSEARDEVEEKRQEILGEADARAEAREKRVRAGISQERRFLRQKALQTLLEHVYEQCMERLEALRDQPDYTDILLNLAADAIDQMKGEEFVLVLPADDRDRLGDELADALPRKVEDEMDRNVRVSLSDDSVEASGGLQVRRQDGAEICDETFEARMERLWPELRHEVADTIRQSDAWQKSTDPDTDAETSPSSDS